MNKLIIICSMILFSGCSARVKEPTELIKAEPSIGIGLLRVSLNREIPLYLDMESDEPFGSISFSVAADGDDKGKYLISADSLDLKPFIYYPGDSEEEARSNIAHGLGYVEPNLTFKVLDMDDGIFRIVLNEETFETAVIKKNGKQVLYRKSDEPYWWTKHRGLPTETPWLLYETWEEYLRRMVLINLDATTIVYSSPHEEQICEDPIRYGPVREVKGNWLKIEENYYDPGSPAKSGWVQWTDGVRLLVQPIAETFL